MLATLSQRGLSWPVPDPYLTGGLITIRHGPTLAT